MARLTCYRCFWPQTLCWCGSIAPMSTRTRFVFLMHPKEYKQEKAATGRLTHLCLSNSEIVVGVGFDDHPRVRELLDEAGNFPVLLYPGRQAVNLSTPDSSPTAFHELRCALPERQLLVFIVDATWALGRKMVKLSPVLQRLPRVMFTPTHPSRFVIKQQPAEGCLSTLEAVHELLLVLESTGLDAYPDRSQLLSLFDRMQAFQIRCATDPNRSRYRRGGYRPPEDRAPFRGKSARRRANLFQVPDTPPASI